MAARTATKTGNWSDVTVWDGGVALPGSGDTADSNGYTVTIDQNVDLSPGGALINTNAGAGGFACSTARTITANVTATVRDVLSLTNGAGVTVTINGNITGGSAANARGMLINGVGTFAITGNITGGSQNGAHGAFVLAAGTVNITGDCTGGSLNQSIGVNITAAATVNITGNVSGGTVSGNSNYGLQNASTGTTTVTGNINASTVSHGAYNTTTGVINVVGNVSGSSVTNTYGLGNNGNGTITVSGTATGGSANPSWGVYNAGTSATVTVNTAVAGTVVYATGLHNIQSGATVSCKIMQWGSSGQVPVSGFVKLQYDQDVNYARVYRHDSGYADLSCDYPAATDVKSGVIYKLGGETGSYAGGGRPVFGDRTGGKF